MRDKLNKYGYFRNQKAVTQGHSCPFLLFLPSEIAANLNQYPENFFYVYILHDSRGFPFYVGKGTINHAITPRVLNHFSLMRSESIKGKTDLYNHMRKQSKIYISIPFVSSYELVTFHEEENHIREYKRVIDGGILLNKTFGGEGAYGHVKTEEHRRKLSVSLTGRIVSKATRALISEANLRRGPVSEETRRKISLVNKGKKLSRRHRKKISLSRESAASQKQLSDLWKASSKAIIVNGKRYRSLSEAGRELNIVPGTLSYRATANFPGYSWG